MDTEMKCNMSNMWNPKMPEGMDLEITHHPLSMKRVVNLIIAMERLKGSKSGPQLSTEFRDESLLNIIMESLVEERAVFECFSAPKVEYSRTEEGQYSVTDTEKRSLVLVPDSMELHAVMLQEGTKNCKVHLNMSTYVHTAPSVDAKTVALGIKDTNLYLSCHKDGDEPTLHLEPVDDKENLSTISPDSDMVRFLFYKQDTSLNVSTLVSVPFNNWYISTALEDSNPLAMCLEDDERFRTFNIHAMSKTPKMECRSVSADEV
ncbi:interleukin-1 beta [Antennarius striatus]|uniref:interleukin-1 beta n=1 Tax=Antennarius striatus TaxID=241820 RepID=UPI0035B38069